MIDSLKCYVYVYLDPRKHGRYTYKELECSFLFEPIYVGKGSKDRKNDHIRLIKKSRHYNRILSGKLKHIFQSNLKPIIVVIKDSLTEIEAYSLEEHYVEKIGRLDLHKGPLANLSDGGIGGTKGYVPSKETLKKLSDIAKKVWENLPKETKDRMAKESSNRMVENNPMKGKRHTDAYKKVMCNRMSGKGNAFYGKKHSKNVKRIMSEKAMFKMRNSKFYIFVNPDGEKIAVYGSFKKFIKENKLRDESIRKVLRGELSSYHGWSVSYGE